MRKYNIIIHIYCAQRTRTPKSNAKKYYIAEAEIPKVFVDLTLL